MEDEPLDTEERAIEYLRRKKRESMKAELDAAASKCLSIII
jgi:hypothetical protein